MRRDQYRTQFFELIFMFLCARDMMILDLKSDSGGKAYEILRKLWKPTGR